MSLQYSRAFGVPKDFPSVLKAFTREVLRSNPKDIYEFGANYFSEVLQQVEAAEQASGRAMQTLSREELAALLVRLFEEADVDRSGALSLQEFKNVMDKAELGLGSSEMAELLAEADVSGDGEIDYNEFVPIAVQVVEAMYARDNVSSEAAEQRQDIADYLLHGLTPSELEEVMAGVFRKADVDGSGTLSLAEFHKCIRDADLGLTRKEINHLMFSADFNGNKQLSWQEFVPLCFDILVEVMRSELRSSQPPSVVETKLVEIFRGADDANSGSLPFDDVRDLLQAADLGLTRLQVHTVMSEASVEEDGSILYTYFAPKAADVISKLMSHC